MDIRTKQEALNLERVTILGESRGLIFYSSTHDSIRCEVRPGDGLPSYFFDLPDHAAKQMLKMIRSR